MQFKKEDMMEMAYGDSEILEKISERIIDTSRWSINYEAIFRDKSTDKVYLTFFDKGATEMQEEHPYEWASDMIDCTEVELQLVTKEEWVAV